MIFSGKSLSAFVAIALGGAVAMGCSNAGPNRDSGRADTDPDDSSTMVDFSTEATGDVVKDRELRMHRLGGTHPTSSNTSPVPDPWVGPGAKMGPVPDPWQGGSGSDPNPPPNPNPNPDPDKDD